MFKNVLLIFKIISLNKGNLLTLLFLKIVYCMIFGYRTKILEELDRIIIRLNFLFSV